MFNLEVTLLKIGVLVLTLAISCLTESTVVNESHCIFADIHARLRFASEIIEGVNKKLPNDLNGVCTQISCQEKPVSCTECKEHTCNCSEFRDKSQTEKRVDCRECRNVSPVTKPLDCNDIYQNGNLTSGSYEIWPQSRISKGPVVVYCDMDDDGGWTVIQRRGSYGNPENYFDKDWNDYKIGFGNVLKDYWIGNDHIFAITNQKFYKLRVDLTDFENTFKYAVYDEFWIEDESHSYILHLGTYSGTAGDSLTYHNGSAFFTKDRKDPYNCTMTYKGAWWYNRCHHSNLNGPYLDSETETLVSISWKHFKGSHYSLKNTAMKIRPVDST